MSNFPICTLTILSALLVSSAHGQDKPTLRVPPGYIAKAGTKAEPYSGSGYAQEIVHEKTQLVLVFVPAGQFDKGSAATQPGHAANEGPVHKVRITRPFYMGKYEVTQAQWTRLMGPEHLTGGRFTDWLKKRVLGDDFPMVGLNWDDGQAFLRKAGDGLRLPTEAEWEYACRAGRTTVYFSGDDLSQLPEYALYRDNSGGRLQPVGSRKANSWGLHDMHGSVFEWCSDWLGSDYYARSATDDPKGPDTALHHVVRGGSYLSSPIYCRAAFRHYGQTLRHYEGDDRMSDYGIRVVRGDD